VDVGAKGSKKCRFRNLTFFVVNPFQGWFYEDVLIIHISTFGPKCHIAFMTIRDIPELIKLLVVLVGVTEMKRAPRGCANPFKFGRISPLLKSSSD